MISYQVPDPTWQGEVFLEIFEEIAGRQRGIEFSLRSLETRRQTLTCAVHRCSCKHITVLLQFLLIVYFTLSESPDSFVDAEVLASRQSDCHFLGRSLKC